MEQLNRDMLEETNRYAIRCREEMLKAHEEIADLQVKLGIAMNTLDDIADDLLCSEKHYLVKGINETLKELEQ